MKQKSLKEMSVIELENDVKEKKNKLMELKFQLISSELKDYSQISKARKDIAMASTFLSMKRSETSE
jgi:large subunit ribosomal protein L29